MGPRGTRWSHLLFLKKLKIHIWQGWVILQFLNVGNLCRFWRSAGHSRSGSGDQTRPRPCCGLFLKGSKGAGPTLLEQRTPMCCAEPAVPHQPGRGQALPRHAPHATPPPHASPRHTTPRHTTPRPTPLHHTPRPAQPSDSSGLISPSRSELQILGDECDVASYLLTAGVRAQKCKQALSWLCTQAQRSVHLEGCGICGNGPVDLLPRKLAL